MKKINKKFLIASISFMASNFCFAELALHAHEHGELKLQIVSDQNKFNIDLDGSAECFLDFEYAAKTDQEKKSLEILKANWAKDLFELLKNESLAKDCKIIKSNITQIFGEGESHSEIEATAEVECQKTVKERIIQINFKQLYPKINAIHVEMLNSNGKALNKEFEDKSFNLTL